MRILCTSSLGHEHDALVTAAAAHDDARHLFTAAKSVAAVLRSLLPQE